MKRLYPFALSSIVFFLVACAFGCSSKETKLDEPITANEKLGPFGARAASEYMPLNLGNTWVYKSRFLGEEGSIKVIVKSKNEEGFFIDSQGGRFKLTSMGLRDKDRYLLLSPLEKGRSWRAQVSYNVAEHFEILEDNAKVIVPAGAFSNCLIVRSETRLKKGVKIVNTVTYAPKVGMIRTETVMEDERGKKEKQVLLELETYSLP